jgi:hypothetical protein
MVPAYEAFAEEFKNWDVFPAYHGPRGRDAEVMLQRRPAMSVFDGPNIPSQMEERIERFGPMSKEVAHQMILFRALQVAIMVAIDPGRAEMSRREIAQRRMDERRNQQAYNMTWDVGVPRRRGRP